jgi:hypothetical protein
VARKNHVVLRLILAKDACAMNSFTVETLKPLLIAAFGLLLAVLIGSLIGTSDYRSLLLGALAIFGVAFWFGSGQWFWPITIASSYLGGTFPVLGGSFTPFHILMGIGVAKFFVEDVIMRRTPWAKGDRMQLLMIVGFMGILTLHGIHDRFGMRYLGSTVWGGRNYVSVYVGLIAFFVTQSVSVKSKLWNKLPYLVLAVTGFDLMIAIVTTVFPSSIYRIYPFYSAVGTAGVVELLTGQEDVTGRIGSFGNFGCVLVAIVFAAISVRQLFNLPNLFRIVVVALGFLAVLYSGFRSSVANLFATFFAAGIRDLRWGFLAVLPLMAALLFGLSAVNSSVVRLPKQIQRSLTFMPGDWDRAMEHDATASNEFRQTIWKLWWNEYFPKRPLLGRGFGFQSEWTKPSIYQGTDYNQTIEVGNIHNGLFACLDAVGIIGTIFFIAWNVQLLFRTFRVSFDRAIPEGFALRFMGLQLAASIICYWFGATTLGSFLPGQFALAGVFLKLHRTARVKPVAVPLPQPIRQYPPQEVAHV